MSYTIYGKIKYVGYDGTCSGVVGGGYVHPYFKQVDSSSDPSKWSDNVYNIDFINEGYYSFDIEDQDLLDVTGSYKKGSDKFYIAILWNSYDNNDIDKASPNLMYAAFIDHTMELATDIKEINLTLLPVRVPIIDAHSFPAANLLTQQSYSMSETSYCDYTWETPPGCSGYGTEISQKNVYDLVTIFDSYYIINTLYDWDEIAIRSVANSTSDSYTFTSAGDYNLSITSRTAWNTRTKVEQTVRVRYNEPDVDFHWLPVFTNDWDGQKLKGQENITFYNDTADLDSRSGGTYNYKWIIEDTLYAGGDNTATYSGVVHSYEPQHVFQSPSTKDVTLTCYWFDGFDNQEVSITKQLQIYPFDIIQDFNWDITPVNRSQNVTFDSALTYGDTFQINNYFWEIEDDYPAPSLDLYTFGTGDVSKFGEESTDNTQRIDNTTTYSGLSYTTVTTRFHSIEVKDIYLEINYYNGWVNVEENITKQLSPTKYSINPAIIASDFTPTGRHQLVTYTNSTVDVNSLQYDVDWLLHDFYMTCNLDNPTPGVAYDNSVTHSGVAVSFQPTHYYQNNSDNDVDLTIRYDDGWQRQQKYLTVLTTPNVYVSPTVDFTWLPSIPISRDVTVTFSDNTTDIDNRHRKSDWRIEDYYELENPNNPNYGVVTTDNFTTFSGVTSIYEPGHNFQSNVNHNILLRYYYDDGFCEQYTEHADTITTTEYTINASFIMSPDANNQYGYNAIDFTNTTTDINNRSLALDWTWDDRSDPPLDTSHITTAVNQPVSLVQQFTWEYASRAPFSCTTPGTTHVNKHSSLEVRYDNGWNDQSFDSDTQTSEAKPYEVSTSISYINTVDATTDIWGQEVIQFTHNIIDTWSAILDNTTDWVIEDYNLDTSDNTTTYTDVSKLYQPTHSYQSAGTREVDVAVDFDDGWGTSFTNHTEIDVTVDTYQVPIMDFTWLPVMPTIVDLVHFTQNHNDARTRGAIDHVDVDFYDDGNDLTVSGTEVFTRLFTPKQDNIPVTLSGIYWDGFEFQVTSITKYLDMANIPPSSSYITTESGVCIPSYTFTATSSDQDDDDSSLAYDWTLELYSEALTDWATIGTGSSQVFDYPFQYEGDYRITLKTTDTEGDFTEVQDTFVVDFGSCTSSGTTESGTCSMGGYIQLEEGWQLISIPQEFGWWDTVTHSHVHDEVTKAKFENYILDQITDTYGNGIVEVSNTYLGDVQAFYSYVVGSTPESSPHNFSLVYDDSGYKEISGFWVKIIGPAAPYVISWGNV